MPAGRSVQIVCSDRSHPGRTRLIETYVEVLNSAGLRYSITPQHLVDATEEMFVGAQHVDQVNTFTVEGLRLREKLRCSLCGLDVSTQGDRFLGLIGQLIDGGESRFTLAQLAAIVGS